MVISTNYKYTNKYERIIDDDLTIYKLLHRGKKLVTYSANADVLNRFWFPKHRRSNFFYNGAFRYGRCMKVDVYDYGISIPNHENDQKETQQKSPSLAKLW